MISVFLLLHSFLDYIPLYDMLDTLASINHLVVLITINIYIHTCDIVNFMILYCRSDLCVYIYNMVCIMYNSLFLNIFCIYIYACTSVPMILYITFYVYIYICAIYHSGYIYTSVYTYDM